MFTKTLSQKFFIPNQSFSTKVTTSSSYVNMAFLNLSEGAKETNARQVFLKKSEIEEVLEEYEDLKIKEELKRAELTLLNEELKALTQDSKNALEFQKQINNFATMVLDNLFRSKLEGHRIFSHRLPWGYDEKPLSFFDPLFISLGIEYRLRRGIGINNNDYYLEAIVPKKLPRFTPNATMSKQLAENSEYSDWVLDFQAKLLSVWEKAEHHINLDVAIMHKIIYESLIDMPAGHSTCFREKVCYEALKRFKKQHELSIELEPTEDNHIIATKKEWPTCEQSKGNRLDSRM